MIRITPTAARTIFQQSARRCYVPSTRPLSTTGRVTSPEATYRKTDTEAFNKEVTQEEMDANQKDHKDFLDGKLSAKDHVEGKHKGYQNLKDKGKKIEEEQERPEDLM